MFQVRGVDGRLVTVDTAPGRHALEFFEQTPAPAGAAPDLVIVPIYKLTGGLEQFQATPDTLFDSVRAGRARLVLDSSCEGIPADQRLSDNRIWRLELHRELSRRGLDSGKVAYLTQDRNFAYDYEGPTMAAGLAPMSVHLHDYFIRALFKPFEITGEQVLAERRAAFLGRQTTRRPKRFVCLNFTVREAKVLLLLKLIREGLWDHGFISFSGFDREVNLRAPRKANTIRNLRAFSGFEDITAELLPEMDALEAKGMTMLGKVHRSGNTNKIKGMNDDRWLWEYNAAWFTIVTETELSGPLRITEKPFKAVMNFSPSIILGGRGSLRLARSFGLQSFPELVDESYDEIVEPRARFEAVWREIDRLCRLPEDELAKLEAMTHETIEHNARRAFLELPGEFRAVDQRLLATLMGQTDRIRRGRFWLHRLLGGLAGRRP